MLEAAPQRHRLLLQGIDRGALEVVVGEVAEHGDGVLDALDVDMGFLRGVGGEREIVGVGRDQHGGEGLARFAERRADQGVLRRGRAFDDRVEPRHLLRRRQHLVLVALGDRGLQRAQVAERVEEALGERGQFRHRGCQHRVGGAARLQGAEHRLAQQQDLGEGLGARLVDVLMDEALQPAGLGAEQREQHVGLADLANVGPGRGEYLRAARQQRRNDHDGDAVEDRDREDAPADRHRADQPLEPPVASLAGALRKAPQRCLVVERDQGGLTSPGGCGRSSAR